MSVDTRISWWGQKRGAAQRRAVVGSWQRASPRIGWWSSSCSPLQRKAARMALLAARRSSRVPNANATGALVGRQRQDPHTPPESSAEIDQRSRKRSRHVRDGRVLSQHATEQRAAGTHCPILHGRGTSLRVLRPDCINAKRITNTVNWFASSWGKTLLHAGQPCTCAPGRQASSSSLAPLNNLAHHPTAQQSSSCHAA